MPNDAMNMRALQAMTGSFNSTPGWAMNGPSMLDMQNIPGLQGGLGMMLSMALQPVITQMTQQLGYAGLQFGGTQNFADHLYAQSFFRENREAISRAMRRDEQTYQSQLLGMARLTGSIGAGGPTAEQLVASRMIAGDIAKMGTVFGDMMPDMFDELSGIRGSAAMMARKIHLGGRYAIDPVTGALGMSGASAGNIAGDVFQELYGPGVDISPMRGLGAGRVGQLYDELQRRGFMGGAISTRTSLDRYAAGAGQSRDQALSSMANELGIDTSQAGWQQKVLGNESVQKALTSAESHRIADRLKNMAGAVSAMRDIFGDMGRPDAPMSQLISGLQALTQGGLANMSPGQMEAMVRQTRELAKMGGHDMGFVMQLMSRGAGLADDMGLDRRFAILASQSALAFGSAFGTRVGGETPGWRALDKDSAIAMDQSLRMNAANSNVVQQINATLRIADEMGPALGDKFKNSAFAKLAAEYREGRATSIPSFTDWMQMAKEAGVDESRAEMVRQATFANEEFGAKYNTGNLGRLAQWSIQIAPILHQRAQTAFGGKDFITDPNKARQVGERAIAILHSMDAATMRDPTKRYDAMVAALKQENTGLSDAQLLQASVALWGNIEDATRRQNSGLFGYQSASGLFDMHNEQTIRETHQRELQVRHAAMLSTALSGLGRGGMLRNFMDVLADPNNGSLSIGDVIARTLGGVKNADLEATMGQLGQAYRDYHGADSEVTRKQALDRINNLVGKARNQADQAGVKIEDYDKDPMKVAERLTKTLGISDTVIKPGFVAKLYDANNRRVLEDSLQAWDKAKKMLEGTGLDITDTSADNMASMEDVLGSDLFNKIKPLIRAAESKGQKIEDVLPGGPEDLGKQASVQKVNLDGPIQIVGNVTIKDDRKGSVALSSLNSPDPVETASRPDG